MDVRELVPFAGATLLAFVLVPVGRDVGWAAYSVALALTIAVLVGTGLTPWQRVPAAARLAPPVLFLVAAALLRHAGGGFTSGVATLALLPVFWIALHGTRAGLIIVLLGVTAFLAVPLVTIGGTAYPDAAFKTGLLFVAVAGCVGATVQRLVGAVRVQADRGVRRERELVAAALERDALLARLELLSSTDPLTATGNRRAWDSWLERAFADERAQPVAVGLLDIDHYKAFNDEHGHEQGDVLLAAAARAWLAELRPGDRLARIGGDEFAVLLPGCDEAGAHAVLDRMARATPLAQTCSGGVAEWDGKETPDGLLRRADLALYRAKAAGRDRIEPSSAPGLELAG